MKKYYAHCMIFMALLGYKVLTVKSEAMDELKKQGANTTNPDINIDDCGNIWLSDPRDPSKIVQTDTPLDVYANE